jgi:hypothetical protein
MKKRFLILPIAFLLIFPTYGWETLPIDNTSKAESTTISFAQFSLDLYTVLNDKDLDINPFEAALKGYLELKSTGQLINNQFLTIIDFSKSSNQNRLFVIDIENKNIKHKSLVAHGRNSGYEFASNFSNKISSYKSSLGFYKTAETYTGKHGFSLRLDGLEFSNSNARSRAIVMHGADYASEDFMKRNGRLGRSLGCPSVPIKEHKEIIETIKDGTCFFIYAPQNSYLSKSKLINSNPEKLISRIDSPLFN